MKIPINIFGNLVEIMLRANAKRATKFFSETQIVRATRKLFNGKIYRRGNIEIHITIGRPNYQEREFIKKCKKAGEVFPVKKIQVKL